MKKILTILFVALSFYAHALNFTIVGASFDTLTASSFGSEQWVDVKATGSYTSANRLAVYIQSINPDGSRSTPTKLKDEQYYTYFLNLPQNEDGSRRVYFSLPETYNDGRFRITVGLTTSDAIGFFQPSVLSIADQQESTDVIEPIYFNIHGVKVEPTSGFYIRVVGNKSEQVYFY